MNKEDELDILTREGLSLRRNPVNFRCPSCYLRWEEQADHNSDEIHPYKEKKCTFCEFAHTRLETLKRQIEVIYRADMFDLPKVIQNLAKHVDLKE